MSYIEKAKQNKMNSEKARAFDKLQQEQREKQIYDTGANDTVAELEMAIMKRQQQNQQQPYAEGLAAAQLGGYYNG